jgi:hypothetical protein
MHLSLDLHTPFVNPEGTEVKGTAVIHNGPPKDDWTITRSYFLPLRDAS